MGIIFRDKKKKVKLYEWRVYNVIYTWNKFSCTATFDHYIKKKGTTVSGRSEYVTGYGSATVYSSYTFDSQNGMQGSGSTATVADEIIGYYYVPPNSSAAYPISEYEYFKDLNNDKFYRLWYTGSYEYADEYYIDYKKGSTSYGEVTSTNRSAYPTNDCPAARYNAAPTYWYEYVGSSKGDYRETVSAKKGTYPTNGISGNYWYELVQ